MRGDGGRLGRKMFVTGRDGGSRGLTERGIGSGGVVKTEVADF